VKSTARTVDVASLTLQPDASYSSDEDTSFTALTLAATNPDVDVELVRVLISAGADVNGVFK
jgi:hypothetical protein